ncbi:hypothetical protein I7I51_00968 [Histoplasma capsulatum]|uniref:Uncharacterized protein n=1 Tax=Ajellomyces capsulatus TaxID=5037 RepID=A0A8A1MIH1_AJECA|nr:hypothetical protein I7I51_00968 [Histoplasma capsulatum]
MTTKVPIYIDIDEGRANRTSAAHSTEYRQAWRGTCNRHRSSQFRNALEVCLKNAPLCTSQLRKGFPEFPEPADQGCGVIPLSDAPRGCKKGGCGRREIVSELRPRTTTSIFQIVSQLTLDRVFRRVEPIMRSLSSQALRSN